MKAGIEIHACQISIGVDWKPSCGKAAPVVCRSHPSPPWEFPICIVTHWLLFELPGNNRLWSGHIRGHLWGGTTYNWCLFSFHYGRTDFWGQSKCPKVFILTPFSDHYTNYPLLTLPPPISPNPHGPSQLCPNPFYPLAATDNHLQNSPIGSLAKKLDRWIDRNSSDQKTAKNPRLWKLEGLVSQIWQKHFSRI